MKKFKLAGEYEAVCEWQKTRQAFRHVAVLLYKGQEVGRAKMCYQNRTWERFEFESVLQALIIKYFKGDEAIKYLNSVNEKGC